MSASALTERLRLSEERVFPLAMVDTDRYQRAVTVIGLLAPVVASHASTIDELAQCADVCVAQARLIASRQAIVVSDLDLGDLVDAARAQRLRELLVMGQSTLAEARAREAADAGLAWAVIEEPDARTIGLSPEQRWVELHLSTGTKLVRTIRMDPDTGQARFGVEMRTSDDQGMVLECANRQDWLETSDDLRSTLEGVTDE